MSQLKKKPGFDTDLRSLLKNQHRKVYSICRFFATNYKEHQQLFINIIAAASQNIRALMGKEDKQVLLLRACINMSALHSIELSMQDGLDRTIQFKSSDYQKSMESFQQSIAQMPDLEKFRLFMEFEKFPLEEITGLPAMATANPVGAKASPVVAGATPVKKNFLPSLKDKLAWT